MSEKRLQVIEKYKEFGNADVSEDTSYCTRSVVYSGACLHRPSYRPTGKQLMSRCALLTWTCKALVSVSIWSSSQTAVEAEGVGAFPFSVLLLTLLPRCLLCLSALTEGKGSYSCLFLF